MMDRFINPLIAAEAKEAAPHNGEHLSTQRPARTVRDAVASRVAAHNATALPPRRVSLHAGLVAAERSLVATAGRPSEQRAYLALRALDQLLTLAADGPRDGSPSSNADLLPVGHPLSTAPRAMTAAAARHARALWVAADPRLDDDVRPLVASAHAAAPDSVERAHGFARLAATDNVPTEIRVDDGALVASLSWLGNSSAAKSARAQAQLRDRYGQFAFQGGLFKFHGFDPKAGLYSTIFGRVVGQLPDSETFELEVHNHPVLGTGIVTVKSDFAETIRAIGPDKPGILDVNRDGNPLEAVPTAAEAAKSVDLQQLLATKKDAPTGWTKARGTKNATWNSDDGYQVTRRQLPGGKTQYTLSRDENGQLSKVGTGETWYDIQTLAEADSADYEKSAKARLSGPAAPAPGMGKIGRNEVLFNKQRAEQDALKRASKQEPAKKLEKYDTPDGQMAQAVRDGDPAKLGRLLNESAAYKQDMEATMSKNKNKPGFDAAKEDLKAATAARNAAQAAKAEKQKAATAPSGEPGAEMTQAAKLQPGDRLDVDGREQTVVSVSQPYTKKVGATDLKQTKSGKKKQVDITFEDADGKRSTKSWWPTTEVQAVRPAKPAEAPAAAPAAKPAEATALTAEEFAAEQGVNLDVLNKAVGRFFELDAGVWNPDWAQNDNPVTGLLNRSLAGDKDARDALLSIAHMTGEASQFSGLSKRNKKTMLDASWALNDLSDNLPEVEPAKPKATASPAVTALETPRFSGWDTGGMYELRNDQPYEPKGRTTQDSPDYTDDPEQLATMFDATTLVNELERAVSSPKNGMTVLEFQAGSEDVPAEAVYEALKKMGADADRVVATVYDIMNGGGSDNAKALTAFRKANNIPDDPGEVNGVPMVDGSFANAITLTGKLGNQKAAGIAAELIGRYRAEGVQNPKIQEVADFLKKQDKYGSARALTEFFPFSESKDPQEQEAFRGLLGLLLVSDGGTDLVIKQLDNAAAFSGGDLTKDATETVKKYGKFADLQRSKALVARGEEDPNSPDSLAGATYRLAAAMAEPTTEETYRGFPLDPDSEALREHTTVGQVINMDVRPTSTALENAVDYSEIFIPDGRESVIMTFPAGEMDGIDVRAISPITHEDEVLGVGKYVIESVDTQTLANGKTVHNVRMRRYSEPDAVAKTETPNATFDMPEGAYALDTSPADTADLAPLLHPTELAKDFSGDALTDQLAQAIEDGTGQGRLRLKDGSEQTVSAEVLRDALKAQGVDTDALIEGMLPDLEMFYDDQADREASLAKHKTDASDKLYDDVVELSVEVDDLLANAEDNGLSQGDKDLLDELRSTLDGAADSIDNATYEFNKGNIEEGNAELENAGEAIDEMYNRQGMEEIGQVDQSLMGLMERLDDLIRETETPRGKKDEPVAEVAPEPEAPTAAEVADSYGKELGDVDYNFDTDGYYKSADGRLEIDNTDDLTQVRYDGELVGEFEKSSEGGDGEMYRVDDFMMSEHVIDALEEHLKGKVAPEPFVYTGKKAEPATAPQRQLVKDLLANNQVPQDVRERIQADLDARGADLNKGQIGVHIAELRDYPGSTTPTNRQLNSVKRELVARGVDEETAQALRDRLETMTRDEVSKEVKKLKAMPDVAGDTAKERGFNETTTDEDRESGVRVWRRVTANERGDNFVEEVTLDNDGYQLATSYLDREGDLDGAYFTSRGNRADDAFIDRSPEALAKTVAEAKPRDWDENDEGFVFVDPESGFRVVATKKGNRKVVVYDDRGNDVVLEDALGKTDDEVKAEASALLDGAIKTAMDARAANPAGFAQARALEDLSILADMAGELRGVAVEGGVWDNMTKAARQAIADLGEPEVLNSDVPGVLDRFAAGTASADDVKAVSDFVQRKMDVLDKQAGPLHSVMLPKVRQFMESLGKVTPLGNEPFTTVATDKTPGDTTLPDGADLSGLKRVGEQAGSNEGGTYEDASGNRYYVKTAKSQAHADSEVLASKLYQKAGVSVVDVRKGTMDGKLVTFSPIVGESGEKFYGKLQSDPEFKQKVQEGFIVDAWLSNWDVAGLNFDNVIVDEAGNPVRVDTGGALEWRAQGQPKTSVGVDFFESSFDADTLRDPAVNAQSAKVFGDMTDEQLDASARGLFNVSETDINRLVDEVMGETRSAGDRDKMKLALKIRRKELIEAHVDYPAYTEPEEYDYNPDSGLQETTPQELKDAIEATFDPSEVQADISTNWTNPRYEAESQMYVTIHPGPDVTPEKWAEIKSRIDSMYDREDSYFDALDREPGTGPGSGLLDRVRLEGGLTVKPLNNESPTAGIVVAVQGHNLEVPEADFFDPEKGPEAIAKWLKEKAAIFDENGAHHIGMWYDKKNQEVVFDVVEVFTPEQRKEAIQAGQDRNQQAIWDLGAFKEIPTGGTGDRAEQPTTGPADSAGDTAEGSGVDDRGGATGLGKDDSQPGSGADQAGVGAPKLTGYAIEQRPDGVHYPVTPLSDQDLRDLRDGKVAPPVLPFVVRDTQSGDVHYYDSKGVRHWGQFGAAGILLTRTGQDGNDEFLLVQRANGLSTEPGKWTVPGGAHQSKADAADPHRTAENELQEETGAILDNNGLRKTVSVESAPDWKFDYTVTPVADDFDPLQLDLDPFELQAAEWFGADDVRDLLNEGKLHSAIDADTVEKLIEAGSTPFEYDPNLMTWPQSASPDFGSRATYKLNDRVEVDYDPDDEGMGIVREGTVVGPVPGSMEEYRVYLRATDFNGDDADRVVEVHLNDMRPDFSEPAKPDQPQEIEKPTIVETKNLPQAAPASPPPPSGPDGPSTGNSGGTPPDGPDGPKGPAGPDVPDESLPDVEPDTAEIAPGDVLSMQKIKERWPDHVVLDNGDIVVNESAGTRGGKPVTRQVIIRRNATEGSNSGKNETYTVYAREVDDATGEVRTLEYKNRSHSNKALGNQVAKMRKLLDSPAADGKFKKAKVDAKAPQPKVLKNIDHPDVKALIEDAVAKAPGRSEEANLGALIQVAGQLSDTPENRESLAERMKDWTSYFGSGEAVRAVFDAVQAGDNDKLGQMRKVTHLSQNGIEIQKDMRVSWTSPDGKKTRTGTVVKRATGLDSKGYGFTDYVYVRFDDNLGKYVHRVSDRLVVLDSEDKPRPDSPLASPDGGQGAPSGAAQDLPTAAPSEATPAAGEAPASPDAEAAARGRAVREALSVKPFVQRSEPISAQEALDDIVNSSNHTWDEEGVQEALLAMNQQLAVPAANTDDYLKDVVANARLYQPSSYAHRVAAELEGVLLTDSGEPDLSPYGPDGFERIDADATPTALQVGDIYQTMGGSWIQVVSLGSVDSVGAAITEYVSLGVYGVLSPYKTRTPNTLSYGTLLRPSDATMGGRYVKSTTNNEVPLDQLENSDNGRTTAHTQSVLALSQTPHNPGLLTKYGASTQEDLLNTLSKFYPQDSGLTDRMYPIYPGAVVYRSDGTIGVVQDIKAKDFSDWDSELAKTADVTWLSGPAAGKKETLEPSALTSARGATGLSTELPFMMSANLKDDEVLAILKDELVTKPAEQKKKFEAAKLAALNALRDIGIVPGPGVELPPTDPSTHDYSQSPVEGVGSLTAALDIVSRRDRDGLNGVPVLMDAGDIEDGQVILHAIENVDGEHQTMVRLTLTSWAGDQLTSRLIDKRTMPGGRGLPGAGLDVSKYEMRDLDKGGSPYLVAAGSWAGYAVDNNDMGRTYIEPIKDANGVTIGEARLHRATDDASSANFLEHGARPLAFHNKLELVLWKKDATPEEVASVLQQFGVKDPGPATPEALKVIKENKMIALLENKTDGAVNYVGDGRAKVLADIEKQWGLRADDIEIEVIPGSGHVQFIAPKEFGQRMADKTGIGTLTHSGRMKGPPGSWTGPGVEGQAEQIIAMLDGDNALLATAERWSAGKNFSGQSSEADVKNQGGNYLFFYTHKQADPPNLSLEDGGTTLFRLTLNAAEALRRLDWFYNYGDLYGRRQTLSPVDLLRDHGGDGTDELMIKHAVNIPMTVSTIDWIHPDAAQRVIDWYNANRGGVLPDGRPITDLFPTIAGNAVATETEETPL